MKKLVLSLLLLTILGIIPSFILVLMCKYTIVTILVGIIVFYKLVKELCF